MGGRGEKGGAGASAADGRGGMGRVVVEEEEEVEVEAGVDLVADRGGESGFSLRWSGISGGGPSGSSTALLIVSLIQRVLTCRATPGAWRIV